MNHVPNQLGELSDGEAVELCRLLRARLIDTVSRTGGHLASSLGAVELIVAIHRVFDTGRDRLVFDVGHQCYAHKILTGRNQAMETLRTFGGIAGFPKPVESESDAFVAGHASNSVSVAIGMARARTLQHADYHVLALIGDGALSGGLAYEGLSDAGDSGEPLIVILNDNGMSITKSVGGVAEHLARQRLKPQYLRFKKGYRKVMSVLPLGGHIYHATHKIKTAIKDSLLPCSLFEDMGFTYLGPVDGHDVKYLTQLLSYAKELNGPVLLHVRTVKGKGYTPAERNPDQFHGVGRFCVETGELVHGSGESFSAVFGETLCSLAEQDGKLCAITAAMQGGTGLNRFARQFPARFFDVGIAEGHAVAMAAGMAKQGMRPVFAVYSSFLQRSYDMLLHDVALQKLHVVLAVDRAGLVGEDGETHHGVFDPAFLDTIPGMTVLCPSSFQEPREMLRYAIYDVEGPVAVRYSRGGEGAYQGNVPVEPATLLRTGADITLAGYGMMLNQLLDCADRLARNGIQAEVVKLNAITPIPLEPLFKRQDGFWLRRTARRRAVWGSASPQACLTLASRCEGWPWRIPDTPLLPMERCPSFKGCAVWTGRAYITEHWRSAVMANVKKRLDVLLVERGLAESRQRAQAVIMSGQVYVREQKVDKAGTQVEENAPIEVRGQALAYVSRGGLKLEKALKTFSGIRLKGVHAIDAGASTGGFTDCMLQNGAEKVYAVDVGYGQLAWSLRSDPRVVCMERTNVRYLTAEQIPEPLDFGTVDVSFISLKLILPALRGILKPDGQVVCLVKPQFEAGREKVGKKGVVRDPAVHLEVLRQFLQNAHEADFTVKEMTFSPIRGPEGNIEYLGHLCVGAGEPWNGDLSALVEASHGALEGTGQ